MKKFLLIPAFLLSSVYAQKMKYVIAYCTIQSAGGTIDTAFNGKDGSITALVDLDEKTASFDWKMPDYSTVKKYTIIESNIKKEELYRTMGIYSIALKCKNKDGRESSINIAISERINKIDIVVVDGKFVLTYNAVEVALK
jgi:hypothetical protein